MLHAYCCCMYPRSLDKFIEGTVVRYSKHAVSAKKLCWVAHVD